MKLPILKSSNVQKPSKGQSILYINEDDKKLYSLDYNGNVLKFEKDFPIDIKNVTISNNNVVMKGNFFIGKNNAGEFELFEGNVENHGNVEISLSNSEQTLNPGYYESIIIPAKPEETLPEIFNGPYTITENGTLNTKDKMLDNNIVINVPETDMSNITPENIKADIYIPAIGTRGTFTSDATATAADILKGKTAGINGQMIVGTYEPSTSSDNQIEIPAGKRAFSIAGADGEFADINGVYIEESYTTSGSIWKHSTNNITFKESGSDIGDSDYEQWYYEIDRGDDKKFINYYTEEGSQRIDYPFAGFETHSNWENDSFNWNIHIEMNNEYAAGDYDGELEYKLTFYEVSNLSSNSLNFYKCVSVHNYTKTWDGYKAIITTGVYSFEETLTTGLTYGNGFTPIVNKVYNQDATIFTTLYKEFPEDAILSNCDTLTDAYMQYTNCEVSTDVKKFGNGSIKINSGGYIKFAHGKEYLTAVPWTAAHFFYADSYTGGSNVKALINNDDDCKGTFFLCIRTTGKLGIHMRGGSCYDTTDVLAPGWHHIRVVHVGGGLLRAYLDGQFVLSINGLSRNNDKLFIGQLAMLEDSSRIFDGYIDGIEFFEIPYAQLETYTGDTAPVPNKEFIV